MNNADTVKIKHEKDNTGTQLKCVQKAAQTYSALGNVASGEQTASTISAEQESSLTISTKSNLAHQSSDNLNNDNNTNKHNRFVSDNSDEENTASIDLNLTDDIKEAKISNKLPIGSTNNAPAQSEFIVMAETSVTPQAMNSYPNDDQPMFLLNDALDPNVLQNIQMHIASTSMAQAVPTTPILDDQQIDIRKNQRINIKIKKAYKRKLNVLEFLGLNPNDTEKEHIRILNDKRKCPSQLSNFDQNKVNCCTGIFTSGWPGKFRNPAQFRVLLETVTDFDYAQGIYYIDIFGREKSYRARKALIRFADNETCLRVYDQLRVLPMIQPKVKVLLDFDNKILETIDPAKGLQKYRDKWKEPTLPAKWRIGSVFTLESLHTSETKRLPIRISIRDLLCLRSKGFVKNKLEIEYKLKNKSMNVVTPRIPIEFRRLGELCTGIYMYNFPIWFEAQDYRHILDLLTQFHWDTAIYYIDILKYLDNTNIGAILVKFENNPICLEVYKELLCVKLLQKYDSPSNRIQVQLDLGDVIANMRQDAGPSVDWTNSKLEPEFRIREVLTYFKPGQSLLPKAGEKVDSKSINQTVAADMDDDVIETPVTHQAMNESYPNDDQPFLLLNGALDPNVLQNVQLQSASTSMTQADPTTPILDDQHIDIMNTMKYNNKQEVLEFLGLNPNDTEKEHIRILNDKRKCPSQLSNFDENKVNCCTGIFTYGWPRKFMKPSQFRVILETVTDFDYAQGIYYIDLFIHEKGYKSGEALIRFPDNETCLRVYDQLRVLPMIQPKVKVLLDFDNNILKAVDPTKGPKHIRIKKWKEATVPAKWRMGSAYTTRPSETIRLPIRISIRNLLCLRSKGFVKNKLEIERKLKNKSMDVVIPIEFLRLGELCTGIYMYNFPIWFEAQDYRHVLDLLTQFHWDTAIYYIDILKYLDNTNIGAILVKFENNPICLEVYKELLRVKLLQKYDWSSYRIQVQLDLGDVIANMRQDAGPSVDWTNSKLEPKFRIREVLTYFKPGQSLSPKAAEQVDSKSINQTVAADMDDDVIIITSHPPAIDLTVKDNKDKGTEVSITQNYEKKNVQLDLSAEDSNDSDKTYIIPKQEPLDPDDELSALIKEELKDLDIEKMIKEDDSFENDTNIENSNENHTTTDADINPDIQSSKENHTATDALNNVVLEAMDVEDNKTDGDSDNDEFYVNDCKVVYVKNLPPINTYTIIKELLSQHTTFDLEKKLIFIKWLRENDTMIPLGECLLKCNSHEDAIDVATSLDGVSFNDQIIEAKLDLGHKVSKHHSSFEGPNLQNLKRKLNTDGTQTDTSLIEPKRAKFDHSWESMCTRKLYMRPESQTLDCFGLSKEYLSKLGCKLPLTCYVTVKNLHKTVTESKLHEVFSLAGEVKQISLSHEKGECMARIEYDHPVESVQAVSMFHGQQLYEKELEVTADNNCTSKPLPLGLSGIGRGLGANGEPLASVRTNVELKKVHDILYETKRGSGGSSGFIDAVAGVKQLRSGVTPNPHAALELLGAVLVSLDIIPSGTDCSSIYSIIKTLLLNPKVTQNQNFVANINVSNASNLSGNNDVNTSDMNSEERPDYNQSVQNVISKPPEIAPNPSQKDPNNVASKLPEISTNEIIINQSERSPSNIASNPYEIAPNIVTSKPLQNVPNNVTLKPPEIAPNNKTLKPSEIASNNITPKRFEIAPNNIFESNMNPNAHPNMLLYNVKYEPLNTSEYSV